MALACVLGGMGPLATVDFMHRVIRLTRALRPRAPADGRREPDANARSLARDHRRRDARMSATHDGRRSR